jgi:hypothetical protein
MTGCIENKAVKVLRGRLKGLVTTVVHHKVGIDLVAVRYRIGLAVLRRGSVEVLP